MPSPCFITSSHCFTNPHPSSIHNGNQRFQFCARFGLLGGNGRNLLLTLKCVNRPDPCVGSSSKPHTHNPSLSFSCLAVAEAAPVTTDLVADRVQRLALEFGSLPEPIDRVKQLLHYAALLPPFDEESRVPANRVTGCTTQVWLDSKLDEFGRVRFRADSDSEITKGFVSCLVWMLDGAEPAEVLAVKPEDLAAMNVGLYHSRVNTWHNVLISMQKRVKGLLAEIEGATSSEPFPALVIAAADLEARYGKTQVLGFV